MQFTNGRFYYSIATFKKWQNSEVWCKLEHAKDNYLNNKGQKVRQIQKHPRDGLKFIYSFNEGRPDMKPLLVAKDVYYRHDRQGLPVPFGFTIIGSLFLLPNKFRLSKRFWDELDTQLKNLEAKIGKTFGDMNIHCLFLFVRARQFPCPA